MSVDNAPFKLFRRSEDALNWRLDIPQNRTIAVSGFSGETVLGRDQLNITPDVNAFAGLISSYDLKPPLSIGLFGDWGSGKSFFMNQLRQTIERNVNLVKDNQEKAVQKFMEDLDLAVASEKKDNRAVEAHIRKYLPNATDQAFQIQQWLKLPDTWAWEILLNIYGNDVVRVERQIRLMKENPEEAKRILEQELNDWQNYILPGFVKKWMPVIKDRTNLTKAISTAIPGKESQKLEPPNKQAHLDTDVAIEELEQNLTDWKDKEIKKLFDPIKAAETIENKIELIFDIFAEVTGKGSEEEKGYIEQIHKHSDTTLEFLEQKYTKQEDEEITELFARAKSTNTIQGKIGLIRSIYEAIKGKESEEEKGYIERVHAHTDATILGLEQQKNREISALTDDYLRRLKDQKAFLAIIKKLVANQQEQGEKKNLKFCRYISQIEFNAWHFVDTNLWASLINHIFEALNRYIGNLTMEEREYIQLYRTLENTQEMVTEKVAELNRTKIEIKDKRGELWNLEIERSRVREELKGIKARDLLEVFKDQTEVQEAENKIKSLIGIAKKELGEALAGDLDDLDQRRLNLKEDRERINAILKSITSPEGKMLKVFKAAEKMSVKEVFFLILFGLLLFMALYITPLLTEDYLTDKFGYLRGWFLKLSAQFTFWGGLIFKIVPDLFSRIRAGLEKVEKGIIVLDQALASLNQLQDKASALQDQEIAELSAELEELEKQQTTLEIEKAELEKKQEILETEKEEIEKGRRFSSFIEERLNSTDYKKHLGLISIIRNDFEKLTNYLHHRGQYSRLVTQFDQPQMEKVDTIDRIILYIDDLDRCPPEKVVEVLQAIHLILAFPLFVVVVGVDVRWVSKSLIKKYGTMLAPVSPSNGYFESIQGSYSLDEDAELSLDYKNNATPFDYLEKIFQIPFRLQVMDDGAKKNYIGKLLEGDLIQEEKSVEDQLKTDPIKPGDNDSDDENKTGDETTKTKEELDQNTDYRSTEEETTERNSGKTSSVTNEEEKGQEITTLRPIRLSREEYDFIQFLSPLLVGSPRTIKRFVNICRLIKSHENWGEGSWSKNEDKWVAKNAFGESGPSQYLTLVFVLAVITGKPQIASLFFDWLRDEVVAEPESLQSLQDFVNTLQEGKQALQNDQEHKWAHRFAHFDEAANEAWRDLYGFLGNGPTTNDQQPYPDEAWEAFDSIRKIPIHGIDKVTDVAARFSFRFTRY